MTGDFLLPIDKAIACAASATKANDCRNFIVEKFQPTVLEQSQGNTRRFAPLILHQINYTYLP